MIEGNIKRKKEKKNYDSKRKHQTPQIIKCINQVQGPLY